MIDIWLHVAGNDLPAADRLVDRFDSALNLLSRNPLAGRDRSELAPGVRSFPVGTYVLFYMPDESGIDLVRVLSGYRDIDTDLIG